MHPIQVIEDRIKFIADVSKKREDELLSLTTERAILEESLSKLKLAGVGNRLVYRWRRNGLKEVIIATLNCSLPLTFEEIKEQVRANEGLTRSDATILTALYRLTKDGIIERCEAKKPYTYKKP